MQAITITTLPKCNATVADAIGKWVAAKTAELNTGLKTVDLLFAEGVNPNHLEAPEKGADRTAFESYKAAIVRGFPVAMQKLVNAAPAVAKAFSDQQKSDRRYWTGRIGADMRDLRAALSRRYEAQRVENLTPAQREAEEREAAEKNRFEIKFAEAMLSWAKKCQKQEACAFSVNDAVKLLKQLAAMSTAEVSKA